MAESKIMFLLVQIDEAHSSAWPVGLENQPDPQKNISERLERANNFVLNDNPPNSAFNVYVDTWNNDFAEIYHAWPDVYYAFESDLKIKYMSTYGTINNTDALIDVDCFDLICSIIN